MARRPEPGTVVRPPPVAAATWAGLARPVVACADHLARATSPDAPRLAAEAWRTLGDFAAAAAAAGLPAPQTTAARSALALLLDARARGNPALDARAWTRGFAQAMRGADAAELRAAASTADRDLARFLGHCLDAAAAVRPPSRPRRGLGAAALALAFVVALAGWAGWLEWRYASRLSATMFSADGASLDTLAATAARIEAEAGASPLGVVARIPWLDPGARARRVYAAAADARIPGPLAAAIDGALAAEGDPAALYDSLRARAILSGEAEWRPDWLAGWIADRAADFPGLAPLAPHAAALSGPPADLAATDPATLAEARRFAAEGDPADRAFVELRRDPGAAALPVWSAADAAPVLADILVRRSGRPLAAGVPGLYTAAGWRYARDGGAAAAANRAAVEADRLVGKPEAAVPEAVLSRLQGATLAAFHAYLADLRVRPFADQPGALLVSGSLAMRPSPLEALVRAVWREVGGGDRSRDYADQIRVAAAFSPAIRFVEAGGMGEISRIFASLNVAVATLDADAELGAEALMGVQERAAGVIALNQAPPVVAQIVVDTLAQTAASNEGLLRSRVALRWEAQAADACRDAIDGRYPFGTGPDADPAAVAAVLGPGGLVDGFFARELAPLVDAAGSPWRWKAEARLTGLSPESAAFFERAAAIRARLLPAGAPQATLTLTALAQSGPASVTLGGATAALDARDDRPVAFAWPGAIPARGFALSFGDSPGDRRDAAGPWGLLHFLDGLRLRPREDGRRFLVDARLGQSRAYFEIGFDSPLNPVAARPLMRGLACPARL
ncbi:ImcF-related family protein [Amaricoccus sp.]|uniref:ImcF-related family protein n=1 Tax=Amaricoccus sp. TaxID=1872485 RepID=UPI001B4FBF55|nr:ImcF-related family protein [Amaricoccus sp.]MBP7241722.1 IcmF-related protein [Amaricoccus sp.]